MCTAYTLVMYGKSLDLLLGLNTRYKNLPDRTAPYACTYNAGQKLRPRATVFAFAAAGPSVEPGGLIRVAEDTPPFGYLSVPDRNGRGLLYISTT